MIINASEGTDSHRVRALSLRCSVGDAQQSVSSPRTLVHAGQFATVRRLAQALAAQAELAVDRVAAGRSGCVSSGNREALKSLEI